MGRDQAFALHMMQQMFHQAIVPLSEGDVDFGHYDADLQLLLQEICLSTVPWAKEAHPLLRGYQNLHQSRMDAGKDIDTPSRDGGLTAPSLWESLVYYLVEYIAWLEHLHNDATPDDEAPLEVGHAMLRYHRTVQPLFPQQDAVDLADVLAYWEK